MPPEEEGALPPPDYSDRPTVIIEWGSEDPDVYGVMAEGFQLPTGVRVVIRDYSEGEMHTDGQYYSDYTP